MDVLVRKAAGPDKEFDPFRPFAFCAGFSTAQKVAFRNNADEISKTIDNRKTADLLLQHEASGNKHGFVGGHRHNVRCHYISYLHHWIPYNVYIAVALVVALCHAW